MTLSTKMSTEEVPAKTAQADADLHLGNSLLYVRLDVRLGCKGLHTICLGQGLYLLSVCLAIVIPLKLQSPQAVIKHPIKQALRHG